MLYFYASFKARWQEWKKKGPHRQESSFKMFMNALNVELDHPFVKKKEIDKEPEMFLTR